MSDPRPIGLFDSGLGGLSVARAIHERLPGEELVYRADHAWLPYGRRTPAEVERRALALASMLIDDGAKAIVIACNTATAVAADALRARFALPIVGMEPAVKPAARLTRSGVIGVLGTGGTLASARFTGLLADYAEGLTVITRPAPELVDAVETGDARERQQAVAATLGPLLERGVDVIVLGCTHFVFLRAEIEAACGPGVRLIDTGPAVARELERRLRAQGLLAPGGRAGGLAFATTGAGSAIECALGRLWSGPRRTPAAARSRIPGG